MDEFIVKIKPLTPLWTGDENRKNTRLRETGIIGSLRWWYEALIRGLGGTACDPTNTKCNGQVHCDACELFGCTGWARKFRLSIEKSNNEIILKLIQLREMEKVEWALLNKTLKIIEKYGAIGGRMVHEDYGVIEIASNELSQYSLNRTDVESYLKRRKEGIENPNLKKFFFSEGTVNYKKTTTAKNKLPFLKGDKGKAKRYFRKKINRGYRFFAYAEGKNEWQRIMKFIKDKKRYITGEEVLTRMFLED